MATTARYAFIAGLVILILAGVYAAIQQQQHGLGETGLHEPVVWGLYVVCFVFFFGVGAGALFVASLLLCSTREEHQPLARAGSIVSLASLMLAGMFITIDLGRPERAILLMLKPQFSSPLIWDFFILNAMIGVAVIYTLFVLRRDVLNSGSPAGLISRLLAVGGKSSRLAAAVRVLAGLMVFGVPVLYILTVRVFATLRARPDWNTSVLGPVFLVSAGISGLAAVCVVAGLRGRSQQQSERAARLWRIVRTALIILIVADITLTLSPFVSMRQFDSPARLDTWSKVSSATILEIMAGLLGPLVIVAAARKRFKSWSVAAGVLILFGVFVKRWHIIIPAMLRRNLPLPAASYTPRLGELAISAAVVAFGVLLVGLLMSFPSPSSRLVPDGASQRAME